MVSLRDLPSLASIFSTHAAITGYIVMIKPIFAMIIPPPLQNYIITYLKSYFDSSPSTLTLIIENQTKNRMCNELYVAAQVYLSTKINRDAARLRIYKRRSEKNVKFYLGSGEVVSDVYEGIQLTWQFFVNSEKSTNVDEYFELIFEKEHRDLILNAYVPYVERKAKVIKNERRTLKMHSYCNMYLEWQPVTLEHPSTFETMAMNEGLKRSVKIVCIQLQPSLSQTCFSTLAPSFFV